MKIERVVAVAIMIVMACLLAMQGGAQNAEREGLPHCWASDLVKEKRADGKEWRLTLSRLS